jgi:hypothetical protein
VEKQGIIRHGAKMLFSVAEATVPKITVVLRKGYGAGYYVMNGRAYEPDLIVGWPTAEISVMGPEGAVNIIFRKQIEAAPEEERDALRSQLIDTVRSQINAYIAAGWSFLDQGDPHGQAPRKVFLDVLQVEPIVTLSSDVDLDIVVRLFNGEPVIRPIPSRSIDVMIPVTAFGGPGRSGTCIGRATGSTSTWRGNRPTRSLPA